MATIGEITKEIDPLYGIESMYNILSTFIPLEVKYDARTGDFSVELAATDRPLTLNGERITFIILKGKMTRGIITVGLTLREEVIGPAISFPMIEETDRTPIYQILKDSILSEWQHALYKR